MAEKGDWERETTAWILRRRKATPELADAAVRYFERVFGHTANPEQAWFGVHTSRVSLTVGGIWLASVAASGGDEKGLWLLVDQQPLVEGWEYRPARSTQGSITPLNWGHAPDITLEALESAVGSAELWQAYERASRKIFNSPIATRAGSSSLTAKAKRRLSDFWTGR